MTEEQKARLTDAVNAVNSAIEEIVAGGGESVRCQIISSYNDYTGRSLLQVYVTTGRVVIGDRGE